MTATLVRPETARRRMVFHRSPIDVLDLVFGAIALVLLVALELAVPSLVAGLQFDVISLFDRLPAWVSVALLVLVQIVVIVANVWIFIWVVRGRLWRLWGTALVGAALAAALFSLVDIWLARDVPPAFTDAILPGPAIGTEPWPATLWLAGVAAYLIVFNTLLSLKWRRVLWWLFVGLVFLRVVTATSLTLDIGIAVAVGVIAGSAALLILGRPDLRPTTDDVAAALESLGVTGAVVRPAAVDARGSTPYFATSDDGRRVFAKVLTAEERFADLMFRWYRRIRFRALGDEKPFSTLRRAVEHEAMLALMAQDVGVRTPPLVGVAHLDAVDAMLLSYEQIDGKSLDSVPVERLTDDVLRQAWTLVVKLHDRQISHRDLRLANVFLDDDDRVWIIDFGFGEAACTQGQKAADIAELLASSAGVGAERAVAAAAAVVPEKDLIDATSRLQPMALSTATRGAVKQLDGGLKGLRDEVARVTGDALEEPTQLERLKPRTIITLVVIGAAVYFILPQLADIPGLIGQMKNINLAWLAPVIIASLATYLGASIGLASSVATRVPIIPAFGVALAGSFVNRLAPVKVAGAALNVRFLQKRGVNILTAVAGAGLISLSGFITHITLTLLVLLAAGKSQDGLPFELPKTNLIIAGVVAVLIVVGIVLWIPRTAKLIKDKVVPALKSTRSNLKELSQEPRKIIGLFAGGLMVPVGYSACLYLSTLAFGGGIGFVQVAVVFLTIGTLAGAAPTPGGVGVVEAALIGGLTGVGLPSEQAVASVFLYRLATFWVPVLPGWISFTLLQRAEDI